MTWVMQALRACGSVVIALATVPTFMPISLAQNASPAAEDAKIAAGENVYNTYCQVCHGDRLVSTGQTFDLRRLTAGDRARFEGSVRNGKNQMPPWKGVLSEAEIDQIWHYIRANAYQK
jgi:mono/diheme cytochrome c family protein